MTQKLTPQAFVQIQHTVDDSLSRIEQQIQELSVKLYDVQVELDALRNIRATLLGLLELLKEQTNG